jgi:hypothetical protein
VMLLEPGTATRASSGPVKGMISRSGMILSSCTCASIYKQIIRAICTVTSREPMVRRIFARDALRKWRGRLLPRFPRYA